MMELPLDCGPCSLRRWREADAPALHRHANSPEVWHNLRDSFPERYTIEDARNWIRFIATAGPALHLAIEVAGEAVGGVSLEIGPDIERCSAEIGYWIGKHHWGEGIATAAVRGATEYALAVLPLTRIFALPFLRNPASLRVLEKAGYTREAVLRRSAMKEGVVLDRVLYAFVIEEAPSPGRIPGRITEIHSFTGPPALPLRDDLR